MPNHVKQVLKFKNLKEKEVDFLINMIATPMIIPTDPIEETTYAIDFDKIIPEPKEEWQCPDDCKVNKDSHIQEDSDRPWFDWYQWRLKHWGTKWGAYDGYTKIGKSYVTFVFSTAWTIPYPVIKKLTLLNKDLEYRWADEDLGANCGKITYDSKLETWEELWEADAYKNPRQFAEKFWDKY